MLKAWVRRRFHKLWPRFEGLFGDFLIIAVQLSRCDRFAVAHFRHSGPGGYVFEEDIEAFYKQLRAFEQGRREEVEGAEMTKNVKD